MPHALRTHDDFRLAPTADLLALFLRTALSEQEAKNALIRILARLPTNKAERQIHAGAELGLVDVRISGVAFEVSLERIDPMAGRP